MDKYTKAKKKGILSKKLPRSAISSFRSHDISKKSAFGVDKELKDKDITQPPTEEGSEDEDNTSEEFKEDDIGGPP